LKQNCHPVYLQLIRISENNVLESAILSDTVYQRQQGTLIVWSENDVCDLALSFQEKSGCAAIWDKICQIQGRDSTDIDDEGDLDDQQSDSSNSNASSGIGSSVALPTCSLTTIQEIDQIILNNMGTPSAREKIANTLHQQK
jgi:protein phosphatase-4 regulatory subunit 3